MARNEPRESPRWFDEAVATPVESGCVLVDDIPINYRAWGARGGREVVLVHGGMAHAHWWDHIAPQLTDGRRVVALDLSGHGDSGRRGIYSLRSWVQEVLAVARAGEHDGPPVLVGHSMGGIVSFMAAVHHAEELDGVILLDSPIHNLNLVEVLSTHAARTRIEARAYPTAAEAVARFRVVPRQTTAEPYVIDRIARHSIRQAPDGWRWKFDRLRIEDDPHVAEDVVPGCRVAFLRSENGVISPELLTRMRRQFGPEALVAELPAAGHHPMIDQPLALVAALQTVLAAWDV